VVVGKSPLTGTFAVSGAGGGWGIGLRRAGLDGVVIRGKAEKPSLLWITEGRVELRPAHSLWGHYAVETVVAARREVGDDAASVVTIGPAGERQVAIACICADEHSFAGRCGPSGCTPLHRTPSGTALALPRLSGRLPSACLAAGFSPDLRLGGATLRESGHAGIVLPRG
jgi:hypothetical protein